MPVLVGIFFNEEKSVTINFKADGSFTLSGLLGYDTEFGGYHFGSSLNIPGFPETIVMMKSTRRADIFRSITYHIAINRINDDSFETISTPFCKWIEEKPQPTTFQRINKIFNQP